MPHSLRLGAGTHADDGRTWQDFDALLQDLQDEPLPPAAAQASRDDARPISVGALNSLGLDAPFGQQSGTRSINPVSFSSFRVPPAPTRPDAGNPSGAADGGSQPVAGTGQTSGTTGNRSLDVVFNAGRIPTLHRAPPALPAPATPAKIGDDRLSLQPAVDRQMITAIPPDGLAGETPQASVEPVIPVGLRGSSPVVVPSPIPFASIMSDKDASTLVRQLASLPHGLRERAAEANDVALKALGFENPAVAAEAQLLASLSQELHERLAKATGKARTAIEKDIRAVADELLSLEYRGQLRTNTLKLLSQVQPDLKDSLNQDPEQSRLEIHHTVPYKDPKARRARDLLEKWGLSIHDPADAAIVPSSYHRGEDIHGMADGGYNTKVLAWMTDADEEATREAVKGGRKTGRMVMLDAIREHSDELVAGSLDKRAILLEQALRELEQPLPRPDLASVLDWKGYEP